MEWAGLVLTLPSVADPEDDEENDGEEAGSLWVKPLHMDGPRARREEEARQDKRGGDLVLVSAEDPPRSASRVPPPPWYACPSPEDSPVQKIDGAAIMDRLRFTTTELAPAGSGQSLGPSRTAGCDPTKGHGVADRPSLRVRVRPGEARARRGTQPRSRGDGRGADPTRASRRPDRPTSGKGSDRVWSRRQAAARRIHARRRRIRIRRHPGHHGRVRGNVQADRAKGPGLPAPVSNPLFETNAGSALDFDAESKDGEKDEIGTPRPWPAALGDRAAAVCATRCGAPTPCSWSCRGPT